MKISHDFNLFLSQRLFGLLVLSLFLSFPTLLSAAAGDLDVTFGVDGTEQIDSGINLNDSAYAVAVQPDGKVIAVGVSATASTGQDFFVARLNQNGTLDTSFGSGGRRIFNFNNNSTGVDIARAVAVQTDGKIIVVGESAISGAGFDIVAARLNADGSFDASFDDDGKAITNLTGNRNDYGKAVALQSDGKIVVSGYSNRATTGDDFVLVRYNTNGSLDTTLNASGITTTDILTNREDRANAMTLQSDGKIVAAGYTSDPSFGNNFAVVRYNADGSLDATFNGTGKVTTDLNLASIDYGNAVAVQNDGKIVVAGQSAADFGLVRYNSNGSPDANFGGGDGIATTNFASGTTDIGRGVIVQNSGRIIVAGRSKSELAFAGYNADGTLDSQFGKSGLIVQNAGNNYLSEGGYWGVAKMANDQFVAVGDGWRQQSGGDFSISRLNADGMFDFSFGGGDGIASTDFNKGFDQATAVEMQPDGKIVVAGTVQNAAGTRDFAVARYNTDGTLDTSFDGDGFVVTDILNHPDEYANEVAIQPDGKIVLAGITDNSTDGNLTDGALIRYNANGSLDTTFGIGGIVITPGNTVNTGFVWLAPNDLAIMPDGRIVVAGQAHYFSVSADGYVARYNANGSRDMSLISNVDATRNGSLVVNFNTEDTFNAVALQSDGKIVVAGSASTGTSNATSDIILARLNPGGSLDASFDGDGKVSTNFDNNSFDAAYDMIIQPNGKIVVAGETVAIGTGNDFAVARYNLDGSLDTSFGEGDGMTNVNYFNYRDYCTGIVVQPDGKIVLGGSFEDQSNIGYGVVKLNSNGTLDTSFGSGTGKIRTLFGNAVGSALDPVPYDMALQSDSKIIVVGRINFNSTSRDFTVVRYQNGGSRSPFDFDGDGKADVSVFRPSNGTWYLNQSTNGFTGINFGLSGDLIAPADYDGDGKTDVAVFRPSSGTWYLQRSQLGFTGIQFGANGDVPMPADFDADGKADLAVFRPSTGTWYLQQSTAGFTGIQFGLNGDVPAAADYDADGKADVAVFRPATGIWYLNRSQAGFTGVQFGTNGDKPVPADYDADGKADLAVFRPSTGVWYLQQSTAGFTGISFGLTGDLPVAADYDADGKADVAVFRPSNGTWYLNRSQLGFTGIQFGASGDKPAPNAFIP